MNAILSPLSIKLPWGVDMPLKSTKQSSIIVMAYKRVGIAVSSILTECS